LILTTFISTLVISFAIQIGFFLLAATFKTDKVTDLSYSLTFITLALLLLFTNQMFFTTQVIIALLIVIWGIRLAVYLFSRILNIGRDSRFDDIRDNFLKFAGFWTLQAVSGNTQDIQTTSGKCSFGGVYLSLALVTCREYTG
jgi:steroid 5-alpha reductase family enzyme